MKKPIFNCTVFFNITPNCALNKNTARLLLAFLLGAFSNCVSAAADTSLPAAEPNNAVTTSTSTNTNAADESPMMLYLVPWNANPETGKSGKKFALYQPWGTHFDPLTPAQTVQLSTP